VYRLVRLDEIFRRVDVDDAPPARRLEHRPEYIQDIEIGHLKRLGPDLHRVATINKAHEVDRAWG
jgi:hypothetical protein